MAGRHSQGAWDGRGHTAVFSMENQQGPAVQNREVYSMLLGSLDGGGSLKENGHMYMYG